MVNVKRRKEEGTFKLATVQECQLNRVDPRKVKGNS